MRGLRNNECLIFLIWDFIGVLYLICPGIGVCSGCPLSDVCLLSGSVSWFNCGSEDISFRAGGLFLAHYGLLLTTAVCWHVTTILPGAPPLPWVTRILHGQWFTCEAPSVCGHHSPVVAEDLTRVIWGHSLCSELILGSKTVINCTWAGGGAVVVSGGRECFMIRGLGSDPPWPWWHRDNGSHGDTDMVITMLRCEHSEVIRGAPSMGAEQSVGMGEKKVGWEILRYPFAFCYPIWRKYVHTNWQGHFAMYSSTYFCWEDFQSLFESLVSSYILVDLLFSKAGLISLWFLFVLS